MKWLLLLSVVLNGFLGWKVLEKKEVVREEVVEKVVVKKSAPEIIEKKVIVNVPGEVQTAPAPVEYDEVEVEDTISDVTKTREDFLVGKLGLTEKDFQEIESIKKRYTERYQKIMPPNETGIWTLEQRKSMLQLEEERERDFARAVGPSKWKEWKTFQDNYNKKLFKRSMKDQRGVIVPMEI